VDAAARFGGYRIHQHIDSGHVAIFQAKAAGCLGDARKIHAKHSQIHILR
jgi:hypothetical protein